MASKIINLDHAAASGLNNEARKQVELFLNQPVYNSDSSYAPAVAQRREIADLKKKTAKLLGVNSPSIFITNGSSDANRRLFNLLSTVDSSSKAITTNIEHQTLLSSITKFKKVEIIKVGINGLIDLEGLLGKVTDSTILISVQYVNNETGIIQQIKGLARALKKVKQDRLKRGIQLPLFLHCDASQAVTTEDIQIPRLGVDALSLNGSKFGALPSSGLLYLSPDLLRYLENALDNKLTNSLLYGKENPLAVISQYYALNEAIQKRAYNVKQLTTLSKLFCQELIKLIPEAQLNPKSLKIGKSHTPHILNFYLPNVDAEKLVILAGLNNVLISTGAACSASKDQPSHVLEALGLSLEQINSSIRVSLGVENTQQDIKEAVAELVKFSQQSSVKIRNK
jgi:cysteine desulfurase